MSLEAIISILHIGGSGHWSHSCRPGVDDASRHHLERPVSPTYGVLCLPVLIVRRILDIHDSLMAMDGPAMSRMDIGNLPDSLEI